MPSPIPRRRLLQAAAVGAVALWVWGAPRLPGLWRAPQSFTPIAGAAPFRRLDRAGALSGANVALLGLPQEAPSAVAVPDLCRALFGDRPGLAIAVFSDANCPNCPEMEATLARISATEAIPLELHHLPILGRSSDLAARADLAARLQGAALYKTLAEAPVVVTPRLVQDAARAAGLDAERLATDMTGPRVEAALDTSRALARRLGLIGTPATVIGRTVVLGVLPPDEIAQIIALERQDGEGCG